MTLRGFVDEADERSVSLAVLNREAADPIQSMLEELFESQPVEIEERVVPEDDDAAHSALVAIETSPRTWDGFWTFDRDRVREINRYIEREL